jgi:F0F1-type ATP synthase assembly protein I
MRTVDPKTLAEAYKTASRVINLALGCIVPPAVGFFLDRKFGTTPILSILGLVFGLVSMFVQIRQLVRELPGGKSR